jgi:TRAP-type mannitol/chloroaromatic compound transport system substrate-binding protein
MKRRTFLGTALGGAAGLVAGCEGPKPRAVPAGGGPAVHTGRQVIWRLASSFPRSLDTIFGGATVLAERVAAMTGGAFQIRVYPAGELVPGLQVLEAAQQGTVQVGQSASYYYIGKNPSLAFETCVPFGMTARQQAAWLEEGGGRALMNKRFADFGVISFPAGNTGVQMGGWFKREVPDLESLKGLKMRIPGMGGKVMAALGVSVQVLPGGEIFPALERGAIDATEWVGPYDDEKLGFHQAARYYYYPGWWEPGPSLAFYVNRVAWEGLPTAYQEVFRTACVQSAQVMQARYDAGNPPALARLLAQGVEMRPFSDDLLAGAREASHQMLSDAAAADPEYREVRDHWEAFRKTSFDWFSKAELAYARFAFPAG